MSGTPTRNKISIKIAEFPIVQLEDRDSTELDLDRGVEHGQIF